MIGRWALGLAALLAGLAMAGLAVPRAALSGQPAECLTAAPLLEHAFPLPRTAAALARKKLDILVVGAGSSTLPGAGGAATAYPARLQAALAAAVPGLAVKVTADVKSRRTADEMLRAMPRLLASAKPNLVIWQTGTVDAMQAVDPDAFSVTIDQGIAAVRNAGADIMLVNAQYSPRTESMIALNAYTENLRWIALQNEVPLFKRFEIMKFWSDEGTFAFIGAQNKLDVAKGVHDCIGRLMADQVIEAARLGGWPGPGNR